MKYISWKKYDSYFSRHFGKSRLAVGRGKKRTKYEIKLKKKSYLRSFEFSEMKFYLEHENRDASFQTLLSVLFRYERESWNCLSTNDKTFNYPIETVHRCNETVDTKLLIRWKCSSGYPEILFQWRVTYVNTVEDWGNSRGRKRGFRVL